MKKAISTILALGMLVAPAASSICFADDQGYNVIDYVSGQIGRLFENLVPEQVKEWLLFLFGNKEQGKNEASNIEEDPQEADEALNEKTLQSVNECDELDCSSTTTLTGREDNIETNIPLAEVTENERAAEIYVETLKATERAKIENRLRIIEAISEEVKKEKDAMKLKMYRDVFEVMKLEMDERKLRIFEKIFDAMRKEKNAIKFAAYFDAIDTVKRSTDDKKLRVGEKLFDTMRKENEKIDEVNVVGGKCEEKINEYLKKFNTYVAAVEECQKAILLEEMKNLRLSIMKSNGAAYASEIVETSGAGAAKAKVKALVEEGLKLKDEMIKVCGEAEPEEVRA